MTLRIHGSDSVRYKNLQTARFLFLVKARSLCSRSVIRDITASQSVASEVLKERV